MSEMNKQLEPKLRFEGFTKVWAESKLFKFYEIIDGDRGKNYPSEKDFTNNGYCMFLNAKNVTKTGFVFNETAYISKEKDHSMSKGKLEMNDLVLTSRGTIGNIANYDRSIPYKNIRINSGMLIIRNKNNSSPSNFLYQYFYTQIFYKCLFKIAFGSAQPQLTVKDIKSLKITFPNVEEQTAIGNFFQQLDKLIELQTRAVESAETYKKSMLQKMFPQKGEKVPRVRFEGFSGDWEQKQIRYGIEKLVGGISISPTDYIDDGVATIPKGAINATGKANLTGAKYVTQDFYNSNIQSSVSDGDLITSLRDLVPSGPNLARIVKIPYSDKTNIYLMPQGVYCLKLKGTILDSFLTIYSNTNVYRNTVFKEKNGTTQVHIRNDDFLNIRIDFPSLKEQVQVANFFQKLDQNIESEKKKLEQYQTMKRAMLQRMFV